MLIKYNSIASLEFNNGTTKSQNIYTVDFGVDGYLIYIVIVILYIVMPLKYSVETYLRIPLEKLYFYFTYIAVDLTGERLIYSILKGTWNWMKIYNISFPALLNDLLNHFTFNILQYFYSENNCKFAMEQKHNLKNNNGNI